MDYKNYKHMQRLLRNYGGKCPSHIFKKLTPFEREMVDPPICCICGNKCPERFFVKGKRVHRSGCAEKMAHGETNLRPYYEERLEQNKALFGAV